MEIDKGLVSGSMALLVLKLLEDGDKYGYQMIEELKRRAKLLVGFVDYNRRRLRVVVQKLTDLFIRLPRLGEILRRSRKIHKRSVCGVVNKYPEHCYRNKPRDV